MKILFPTRQHRQFFPGGTVWALLWVILGIVLRLRQLFINRSLWLDEALLANNIVDHSLRFLMTSPLDSGQAAPIGFLLVWKTVGKLLGYRDLYLRLVPFLLGIGTVWVGYYLSRRFQHPIARHLLIGLLAISPVLIYYSVEVKQYIGDTFFCTLLLWMGLEYRNWRHGEGILALAGVTAIFFSSPSVFVLAAVGMTSAGRAMQEKDRVAFLRLAGVGILWGLAFIVNYFLSLRHGLQNTFLLDYWKTAFAPMPDSLAHAKWYLDSALALASIGFSKPEPVAVSNIAAWYAPSNFAVLVIGLAGMVWQYWRDRQWFFINLLVLLIATGAAFLKFYPLRSRLVLFLIPIMFSYLCTLVDGLLSEHNRLVQGMGLVSAMACFLLLFFPSVRLFLSPTNISDIKGAFAYIQAHQTPGDQLAYSDWSSAAYHFYEHTYQLENLPRLPTIPRENDPQQFLQAICTATQPVGRVWIVFSHRMGETRGFLDKLSRVTPPKMQWQGSGAGAYLFNFSDTPVCP